MKYRRLRSWLAPLRRTPLHPQWLVLRAAAAGQRAAAARCRGRVLDIGCAGGAVQPWLPAGVSYIGLDYFATAVGWYQSRPRVFGDGQRLPFPGRSFDTVLLLDVLEHLPEPETCLLEIHRVLVAGGRAVVQVPFLYPVHDAPLDFHRWTLHGLRSLTERSGFTVAEHAFLGKPPETAALLSCLALGQTGLTWLRRGNPLAVSLLLLPLAVPLLNLAGWALGALSPADPQMAHGYRLVLEKG